MSMVQLPDGTWVRRENVMSIGLVAGAHGDRVRVTVATPVGVTEAFLLPDGEAPSSLRDRVARAVNGTGGLTRERAIDLAEAIHGLKEFHDHRMARDWIADVLMEHFS